jgi:hypothetical protein
LGIYSRWAIPGAFLGLAGGWLVAAEGEVSQWLLAQETSSGILSKSSSSLSRSTETDKGLKERYRQIDEDLSRRQSLNKKMTAPQSKLKSFQEKAQPNKKKPKAVSAQKGSKSKPKPSSLKNPSPVDRPAKVSIATNTLPSQTELPSRFRIIQKDLERQKRLAERKTGFKSTNIYLKPVLDSPPNIRAEIDKLLSRISQRRLKSAQLIASRNPVKKGNSSFITSTDSDSSTIPVAQTEDVPGINFSFIDWPKLEGRTSNKHIEKTEIYGLLDENYPLLGEGSAVLNYFREDGWQIAALAEPPKEPHLVLQDLFIALKSKLIPKKLDPSTSEEHLLASSENHLDGDAKSEDTTGILTDQGSDASQKALDSRTVEPSTTRNPIPIVWEEIKAWVKPSPQKQTTENDPENVISSVSTDADTTIPEFSFPETLKLPPPELTLAYTNPHRQWVTPGFGTLDKNFMSQARARAIDRDSLVTAPVVFPDFDEEASPAPFPIPDPRKIQWKKLYQWEGRNIEAPTKERDTSYISSEVIGVTPLADDDQEKVINPNQRPAGTGKNFKKRNDLWHKQIGDDSDWILDVKLWNEVVPEDQKVQEKTDRRPTEEAKD